MNHHSGSESDQKGPTKSKSEESSSISFSTGARPKRTVKEETSTSGVRASKRRKFKSSNAAEAGTIGNEKDLLSSSTDNENLSAEAQEELPTSDSSEANEDVTEGCVQLSDLIWMFPNRRISTYGEIYEGELRSGICDAVPIVLKLVENTPQNMTEARILAKLKHHSHVLSLIQADTCSFRFVDQIYIALDKCHHENLREFVMNRKERGFAFNLSRAIEIAGQMVDGVKYIHENRIIHKDIKPDNILFSPNLRLIKIADFGLSQEIESTSTEVFEKGQFGTNGFRPPESFGGGIISQKSDIFSLGVTFYFVLSNGEHPFGEDRAGWNYHMQNGEIDFTGLSNIRNLKTTEHLIKSMIEHKLNHRPTIWQVSEHPFWTGNEVSCDFDYHCPESSSSLIPLTPEETSPNMDWNLVLEHIKGIEISNKAAAAKSQQRRIKGSDEDPTSSETKPDLAAEGTKIQVKLGTQEATTGARSLLESGTMVIGGDPRHQVTAGSFEATSARIGVQESPTAEAWFSHEEKASRLLRKKKYEKLINLLKDLPGTERQQTMLAESFFRVGKDVEARDCIERLRDIMVSLSPRPNPNDVIKTIQNYTDGSLFIQALILLPCASKLCTLHPDSNDALQPLVICLWRCKDVIRAMSKQGDRMKAIAADTGIKTVHAIHADLQGIHGADPARKADMEARCLKHIATSYDAVGKVEEAIKYLKNGCDFMQSHFGPNASKYSVFHRLLWNRASFNMKLRNYHEVERLCLECLAVEELAEHHHLKEKKQIMKDSRSLLKDARQMMINDPCFMK